MQKKSIYVSYIGGTIGMKHSNQGYIPVSGHLQCLLANMPEFHRPEMPSFTIHEYEPLLDSANMVPADWQIIANDIEKNYDLYDGFVILHGTDTMSYTASALSFMLENLAKPVIITGSQIPLSALRSDGQPNLLNALYLAATHPINEVSLFFNHQLYRGNRSTKAHANGFDAFASPNFPILLKAGINIRYVAQRESTLKATPLKVHQIQSQPIGVITLYPGISIDIVANLLRQPVKAVILLSYGVGNAPQQKDLLQQLKQANEHGIIIVNLTQCFSGQVEMQDYATGSALAKVGVISGSDMTFEAVLTKLHYLFSLNFSIQEITQLIPRNLRGELTEF